jgi:uncharacterized protein YndB with AHSA1/START domain
MKVQRSVEIKATPEKVWPWLTEPEKIMKWFTLLKKFEYTGEKRDGPGATFYYEEKSGGQLMKMNYKVSEWVENKKIAFVLTSGSLKKDDQVWSLESTTAGSRFTMFEDLEMGILGKVAAPFIKMMVGKNMEKILANLKKVTEA